MHSSLLLRPTNNEYPSHENNKLIYEPVSSSVMIMKTYTYCQIKDFSV